MPAAKRFIYFDLGNVILHFDHQRAARQIAALSGVDVTQVHELVFSGDLQLRYETGKISSPEFYQEFCNRTGCRVNYEELLRASSDMFEVNTAVLPIVAHLRAAGYRLGVLSNTCAAHWDFVSDGRYAIVQEMFDHYVLSFRVGHMKPDREIYRAAAETVNLEPQQILFTDDLQANVDGARDAGIDAVLFTGATALAEALRERGFGFNY